MKRIKVQFVDMPTEFDPEDNFILDILRRHYDVELTDQPDFLFYSFAGLNFLKMKDCIRIFAGGEPVIPNFNDCDYAFGYVRGLTFADRYLCIPELLAGGDGKNICAGLSDRNQVNNDMFDRKFCNFVYSNSKGRGAELREKLCKRLMEYKQIDCPGRILHNIDGVLPPRYVTSHKVNYGPIRLEGEMDSGQIAVLDNEWHATKRIFLKQYKFTIAFENISLPGFTSEKLYDPIHAFSIPIYWGDPCVTDYINKDSFINCNDYGDDIDAMARRVIELDQDREAYMRMLRQNPVTNKLNEHGDEQLEAFLVHIIEKGKKQVRNQDATDAWPHVSLNAAYIWRQHGWDPLVDQQIVQIQSQPQTQMSRNTRLKEAWKMAFPQNFATAKRFYQKCKQLVHKA